MSKPKWEQVEEKLSLVEGWARDGLTNIQIAENLGIGKTTFYKMVNEHPELSELLKKGKEIVDYEVENALLKRAIGYRYKEVTKEQILNPMTSTYELRVTKEVEKEVPPDVGAAMAWLKNRKPKQWRDKPQFDDEKDDGVVIIDELSKY